MEGEYSEEEESEYSEEEDSEDSEEEESEDSEDEESEDSEEMDGWDSEEEDTEDSEEVEGEDSEEEEDWEEEEEHDEDGGNEDEQEYAWCISLHLDKNSLVMEHQGECGTSTNPGISTGTARYTRVPARGTGRREEGMTKGPAVKEPQPAFPLQLQPLKDGQVET